MHEDEKFFLENFQLSTINCQLLTVLWSAKEAVYKWYSLGKVDFKEHMQIANTIQQQDGNLLLPFIFKKDDPVYLNIVAVIFEEIVLCWVV